MAAPTFIAKSTEAFHSNLSMDQPYMGGISSGDNLFILVWSYHAAGGAGTADINTPADWELVGGGNYEDNAGDPHGDVKVFHRKANGSETGNVTITRVGGDAMHSQMYQFRGTNPVIEDSQTKDDGNGDTTITWLAVNVGGNERTLIAFVAIQKTIASAPTLAGYSADAYDFGGVGVAHELAVFSKENVSSDGQVTSSDGGPGGWVSIHISLFSPAGRSFIVN